MHTRIFLWTGAALLAWLTAAAPAATIIWNGTGNWNETANWNLARIPIAGDDVVITNGSVTLTNSTPALSSCAVTNAGTLLFSGWTNLLTATNIWVSCWYIGSSASFDETAGASNRVYIACSNLWVGAGGYIYEGDRGYRGAQGTERNGKGPGYGQNVDPWGTVNEIGASGAGHGGRGGLPYFRYIFSGGVGGYVYDSVSNPICPGSGGANRAAGAYGGNGGAGGGAIYINATGDVTIEGQVGAPGDDGILYGAGGSGGSVYIACNRLLGNGQINAQGGTFGSGGAYGAGAGGGGRVAIYYNPASQATVGRPGIRFNCLPGNANYMVFGLADAGTIWFPDFQFLTNGIDRLNGQLVIGSETNWSVSSLTISNCWVRFANDGFKLVVSNDLVVIGGGTGRLDIGGSTYHTYYDHRPGNIQAATLEVGGNLILTNSGNLYIYSAPVTNTTNAYGALIDVAGDVVLHTNTWIYPYSAFTNGGAPWLRMNNLLIATNAGVTADWAGYVGTRVTGRGCGPGGGYCADEEFISHAGGYGGRGGMTNDPTYCGLTYGAANVVVEPGSGGSSGHLLILGGHGGGLIRIEARDRVIVNGTLSANGLTPYGWWWASYNVYGAGGSGGGINIRCYRFDGTTNAVIRANGGSCMRNGGGATAVGGGGGGRIAIFRAHDYYQGSYSVNGGAGWGNAASTGQVGSVYFGQLPVAGTVFMFR